MTPEDRFALIEADLQFTARLLKSMTLRHTGLRGMYRQGVNRVSEIGNRVEELADQAENHHVLLSSLMESQMRTEASVKTLSEALAEAQLKTEASLNRLSDTFNAYLESQKK
jgi:hypothetical protein